MMTSKGNPRSKSSDEFSFTHSSGDTTLVAFALEWTARKALSLDDDMRKRMVELRNELVKTLPQDVVDELMGRAEKHLEMVVKAAQMIDDPKPISAGKPPKSDKDDIAN